MIAEYSHNQLIALCQQSKVGKKLPTALYVRRSAIASLLTKQEEAIGLFHEILTIGTRKGWKQRLQEYNFVFWH